MSLEVGTLRALAHPIRLQILSLLTGAALSATEVADELGISQANASYHLRTLATAGYVVVDSEESIRGGIAKRYRHPWDVEVPARHAEDGDYLMYIQAVARELVRRGSRRDEGFRPRSDTDAELWVEREVWSEVVELVERASTMLHASARHPRSEGTVHVNMTAVLFGMSERQEGSDG